MEFISFGYFCIPTVDKDLNKKIIKRRVLRQGKTRFIKKFRKQTKTHNILIVKEAKNPFYFPCLCAKVRHNRQINKTKFQSSIIMRSEDPARTAPNIATHPAPSTEKLKKNYTCCF